MLTALKHKEYRIVLHKIYFNPSLQAFRMILIKIQLFHSEESDFHRVHHAYLWKYNRLNDCLQLEGILKGNK